MLFIFFSIFLVISLALTQIFALIPTHLLEFGQLPSWLLWSVVAVILSWLIGD